MSHALHERAAAHYCNTAVSCSLIIGAAHCSAAESKELSMHQLIKGGYRNVSISWRPP